MSDLFGGGPDAEGSSPQTPPPPLAPVADWYPDPENSTQLRYWDGQAWTEHFHPKEGTAFAAPGPNVGGFGGPGLVPIGKWLDGSFKGLFRVAAPLLKVAALTMIPIIGLFVLLGVLVTDGVELDLEYDGVTSNPTGISGFGASKLFLTAAIVLAVWLLFALFRLVVNHLLYWSHRGQVRSGSAALRSMGNRYLRSLGWYLLFVVALMVVYAVVLMLLIVPAAALSPIVLVVTIPAVIAVGFWLLPRLAMFEPAIAMVPKGTSPFSAVARLTRGRWGPITGRVLIAGIGAAIANYAVQTAASFGLLPVILSVMDNSAVEFEQVPLDYGQSGFVVLRDGVPAETLQLSDVMSTGTLVGLLVGLMVLYAVAATVQHIVFSAATTHMYADLDGPAEVVEEISPNSAPGIGVEHT